MPESVFGNSFTGDSALPPSLSPPPALVCEPAHVEGDACLEAGRLDDKEWGAAGEPRRRRKRAEGLRGRQREAELAHEDGRDKGLQRKALEREEEGKGHEEPPLCGAGSVLISFAVIVRLQAPIEQNRKMRMEIGEPWMAARR